MVRAQIRLIDLRPGTPQTPKSNDPSLHCLLSVRVRLHLAISCFPRSGFRLPGGSRVRHQPRRAQLRLPRLPRPHLPQLGHSQLGHRPQPRRGRGRSDVGRALGAELDPRHDVRSPWPPGSLGARVPRRTGFRRGGRVPSTLGRDAFQAEHEEATSATMARGAPAPVRTFAGILIFSAARMDSESP